MGKRFNFLFIVFCAVLLYACYYFALPHLINLKKLNPSITNYVKVKYGYNINIENPDFKMGLSPSLWLKADKFLLINDDNSVALSVNKPVIKISIIPLLLRQISLKYFSADYIFADLNCDNKRNVTIGQ